MSKEDNTIYKKIASNFSGTREQLLKLLGIITPENPQEVQESIDYSSMKVTELKDIAKARGHKGYSTLKKAELIDLLTNNG
tara:strand:- start:490 stop:732 length:243 start_codon:yes stop_codon:yes gene_type:complete